MPSKTALSKATDGVVPSFKLDKQTSQVYNRSMTPAVRLLDDLRKMKEVERRDKVNK